MSALWIVALRNVLRNRRRTAITLAALFVGVGVLVTMRGLLNGLQAAMVTNVSQGQVGALQIHRAGYMKNVLSTPLELDMDLTQVLPLGKQNPDVLAVAPRIMFAGMISSGDTTLFLAANAVDAKTELLVCPNRSKVLTAGSGFVDDDNGMVLTTPLAGAVGIVRGVEAALLAPDRDGALSGENVRLLGTMDLTLGGERKLGLVPLGLAQKLLKMQGRATELAVAIRDITRVESVASDLRKRLGPGFEVHTWAEVAPFILQAMNRQNFVIQFIASAFMLLMLLGVANTMLMSVLERTREIGTMMAVGVRRRWVLSLFVIEALAIGSLGGILGAGAGAFVTRLLGRRGIEMTAPGMSVPFTLVPQVGWSYLGFVVVLAASGAALFAIYPAVRASRLRPVEALADR